MSPIAWTWILTLLIVVEIALLIGLIWCWRRLAAWEIVFETQKAQWLRQIADARQALRQVEDTLTTVDVFQVRLLAPLWMKFRLGVQAMQFFAKRTQSSG